MMTTMDFPTGVVVLYIAAVLATLHILTQPKNRHWQNLPAYLRAPLFPAAGLMAWRGVDLLALARVPIGSIGTTGAPILGHANGVAFLAVFGLAVVFSGLLAHVLTRTYPVRLWDRLNYIEKSIKARRLQGEAEDALVPALLDKQEVVEELSERGFIVFNAKSFMGDELATRLDDAGAAQGGR